MNSNQDWRIALQEWLKKKQKRSEVNSKKASLLQQEFIKNFPKETIPDLTYSKFIEEPYGFYYWLTDKTKELGKYIRVVKSGFVGSQQFENIKLALIELTDEVENNRFDKLDKIANRYLDRNNRLKIRLLYLYFPSQFLPIANPNLIKSLLNYFKQTYESGICKNNLKLLKCIKEKPDFQYLDTHQITEFLHSLSLPVDNDEFIDCHSEDIMGELENDDIIIDMNTEEIKSNLQNIFDNHSKNIILYGTLGTGKTHVVNQFAKKFLRIQAKTPLTHKQYLKRVIKGLELYDLIALAMYLSPKEKGFTKENNNEGKYAFSGLEKLFKMALLGLRGLMYNEMQM